MFWVGTQGEGTSPCCTLFFSDFRTSFSFFIMIGMMRPFYQAHWDISKDIKHVWLLICTYYIAWIFQWILSGEGRGENGDCSRSVVRTVSTGCETPQCAASWMLLLYAGDSSRWLLTPSPQFLSRGAQTFWHRARAYSFLPLALFGPLPGFPAVSLQSL